MRLYALEGLKVFSDFKNPVEEWRRLKHSRPMLYADKELLLKDFESKKFLLLYELFSTVETLKDLSFIKNPEGFFTITDIRDPKQEVKKLLEETFKRFPLNKLKSIASAEDVNKKSLAIRFFVNLRKLCEYAGLKNETLQVEQKLLKPLVRSTIDYLLDGNKTITSYRSILSQFLPDTVEENGELYHLLSALDLVFSITLWSKYLKKYRLKGIIAAHDPAEFVKKDLIPLRDKVVDILNGELKRATDSSKRMELLILLYRVWRNYDDLMEEVKVLPPNEDFGKFDSRHTELERVRALLEEQLLEQFLSSENVEFITSLGAEEYLKDQLLEKIKGKTLAEAEDFELFNRLFEEEIQTLKGLKEKFLNSSLSVEEKISAFEEYKKHLERLGLSPSTAEEEVYKHLRDCLKSWRETEEQIELYSLTDPVRALEILERFEKEKSTCVRLFADKIAAKKVGLEERVQTNIVKLRQLWEREEYVELAKEFVQISPPKGSEAEQLLKRLKELLSSQKWIRTYYKGREYYWVNSNSFSLGRTPLADWFLSSRLIPRVVYKFKRTLHGWRLEFFRAEGNKPAQISIGGIEYKVHPGKALEITLPTDTGKVEINDGIFIHYKIDEEDFLHLWLEIDEFLWRDYLPSIFPDWKNETSKLFLVKEVLSL